MTSGSAEPGELRIAIAEPDELFERRSADVANGVPTLPAGIDTIRSELSSGSVPERIAIVLPRQYVSARTEQGIREAVGRYCELGIGRVDDELKAIHREGRRALLMGLVILAVSLALAQLVLHSTWPSGIRNFFGDGLFLVAAWVGMWYPLELLIYAGRPHRNERRLLRMLLGLEVAVRSVDAAD